MNAYISASSWIVIVMEITAGLLVACTAMLLHLLRQTRRDKENVRTFVAAAHNDLKSRKTSILDVCEQRFRLGAGEIDTAVEQLVGIERDLYKALILAYHNRDGISLLRVHSGLKKLLWACFDIVPTPSEFGTPENEAKFKSMEIELAEAEVANKRLHELISRNQQEMTQLLAEYQRIFKKSQEQEEKEEKEEMAATA